MKKKQLQYVVDCLITNSNKLDMSLCPVFVLLSRFNAQPKLWWHSRQSWNSFAHIGHFLIFGQNKIKILHQRRCNKKNHVSSISFTGTQTFAGTKWQRFVQFYRKLSIFVQKSFRIKFTGIFPYIWIFIACREWSENNRTLLEWNGIVCIILRNQFFIWITYLWNIVAHKFSITKCCMR